MSKNPTAFAGRLLVVEDETELRFILTANLRAGGFEVIEAGDGLQAVRTAAERQPDVIIMDIGLPLLDGIAATRALKADPLTAHIPIIMLTARSKSEDVVKGLDAGAQEYIFKPFEMTEVLARVRTVYRLAAAYREMDRLNSRLEDEVDLKTTRLRSLYEYMRELNHADSQERVLDLIMRYVQEMTHARRISLLLRDAGGEHLVCERAIGIDPAIVERIRIGHAEGIAGQVFQSGKTLAARAYGDSVGAERDYLQSAFVSTPLVTTSLTTQEGVIGVLNVTERADDQLFTEEEVDCIRSIADAGAIALDNILRRTRLQGSVRVLLRTVGHLAEYRDEETTRHLERVTHFARILARELQREGPYAAVITNDFVDSLIQASPMHDIGKVGIPDDILTKPGKLTDEEFQIMKTHTDIGRRVLSRALDPSHRVPLLEMCIDIAYSHHERFDGRGYPRRIKGTDIPLSARIIALVDAYDAITSHRRYKSAQPHEVAVERIQRDSGKHFDPKIVDAFLRCHDRFGEVAAEFKDELEYAAVNHS